MFVLNSRLGLSSAASIRFDRFVSTRFKAPLFPKLRGHFAEFLNEGFPAHLRILSPPTCVGLRYGRPFSSLEAFLDSLGSASSSISLSTPRHSSGLRIRDLPRMHPTSLDAIFHPRALLTLLCHSFAQSNPGGTGISTSCPSPTRLRLGLGPDLP